MNQQFLSNQEIPCISWNAEVRYYVDEPTICPHPEPDESNPSNPIQFHPSIIILSHMQSFLHFWQIHTWRFCSVTPRKNTSLFLGNSVKIFLMGLRAIPLDVQGVEEKKEAAPFTVFLQRK